jgi:hypothetical protein
VASGKIDYIWEQVPNRLKEPLRVLLEEEIDIEDAQGYEPYFKNYPNHHISHLLLEKFNMLVAAESLPNQYHPPCPNAHVPAFDERLEQQALLLRETVEEYDEGYAKIE